MRSFRILAVGLGILALVLLLASGPATRANLWSWEQGLRIYSWAAYAGLAAAGLGLALALAAAVPRWRPGAWMAVAALCAGIVAAAPPILLLEKAKSVPPIHDITTDTDNPPRFDAIAPLRANAPNGVDH
ncbi:MAG TPA: hypothetical protein VHP55_12365, partial [Usitatibacter sp.]|nr:hypothetical protein [Usitatibacter sp.]